GLSAAPPSRRLCRTFVAVPTVADPGPGLDGHAGKARLASRRRRQVGAYGSLQGEMARCTRCGGDLEERFRFCPWCAAPQRRKIVEFFSPHPRHAGKALRVTRSLT